MTETSRCDSTTCWAGTTGVLLGAISASSAVLSNSLGSAVTTISAAGTTQVAENAVLSISQIADIASWVSGCTGIPAALLLAGTIAACCYPLSPPSVEDDASKRPMEGVVVENNDPDPDQGQDGGNTYEAPRFG